ncbi:MAG: 6-carboxytetrahydropterin synthase [Bacteroidetes bacterium]|nr:6-carboxytetrahydropterin synthase [Bacteroidota bacterium]
MELTISRESHFNAAHRLNVEAWTEAENKAYFGLCNNPNYHGHNYKVIVSLTGEVDPVSGYLFDLKILKQIIDEEIELKFDHKNLNLDVEEFKTTNPTVENISILIWKLLRNRIDKKYKLKITLYETERNFVEYNGN